jgi:hypothetical protein
MHDPDTFEDPFEFKPERYLKEGKIDPSVPDGEQAAFGFGRRLCPGRHFSNDTLFLFTASLLSTFFIEAPKDEAGNSIHLELKVTSHFVRCVCRTFPSRSDCRIQLTLSIRRSKPLPFKCTFIPRPGRERLIV